MEESGGTTVLVKQERPRAMSRAAPARFALLALVAGGCGIGAAWLLQSSAALDQRILIVAVAMPFAVLIGLLAVVRFEWFVLAVLAIRPSLDIFSAGGLGPGPALAAVFAVMAALWLIIQYRSDGWVPLSIAARSMLVFVVVVMIAVTTSSRVGVSSKSAIEIVTGVAMFIVLEQLLDRRPDLMRQIVIVVLASGVVPVLVGAHEWLIGDPSANLPDVGRVQSTFAHPNPFATYLTILILLTVSLATHQVGRRRVLLLLYLAALGFMLTMTYHRAGWAACVVGLLYIGLRRNRWIVVGLVGALAVMAVAVPSVTDRIADLTEEDSTLPSGVPDNSLQWRTQYWNELLPMASDSPLTGIGPQVVLNTRPEGLEPHNVFVQTYVETGLLGIIVLVGTIAAVGRTLAARRHDATVDLDETLAVAAIAIAIALLVQSPSENLLNQTMAWWYFAAAATWGFRRTREVSLQRVDVPPNARSSAAS